jgi:hypothetical protein
MILCNESRHNILALVVSKANKQLYEPTTIQGKGLVPIHQNLTSIGYAPAMF